MRKINFRNNIKIILAFIIGIILSGCVGAYAAIIISASNVGYKDTYNIGASNAQEAMDKLYQIGKKTRLASQSKFVEAYTGQNCYLGNEDSCVVSTCYKEFIANSCPKGTLIYYKVNDSTIIPFRVANDSASTITMISAWPVTESKWGTSGVQAGPVDAIAALNVATTKWFNCKTWKGNYPALMCSSNGSNSCYSGTGISYGSSAKAVLPTIQLLQVMRCNSSSCSWLKSTSELGSASWVANYRTNNTAWEMGAQGTLTSSSDNVSIQKGVRAVVEVDKYSS